jgi:pimeloyl-ACP methyl ester carboxylesterase
MNFPTKREEIVMDSTNRVSLDPALPRIVRAKATPLEVLVWGAGPRVLMVHGGVNYGAMTWSEQRPLSERWRLELVSRRGYGNSPAPAVREDFEVDAQDIVTLFGDGVHLVGHSYGAIGALYAAALRPQGVRSLTINEPPAFHLAKGNSAADAMAAGFQEITHNVHEERAFLEAFIRLTSGSGLPTPPPLPNPLPPELAQRVRMLMTTRDPAEAEFPLDALKRTTFPKLVTSGGHHPAFEAVCDVLQRELKTERAIIRGAGHVVPRTGTPFNERLEAFWKSV